MGEEWGPWIEHDGKGCPCAGQWTEGVNLNGRSREGIASQAGAGWVWLMPHPRESVIRYRIRRPKGMAILDAILRNLPERIDA